jgi:hypothetical protein
MLFISLKVCQQLNGEMLLPRDEADLKEAFTIASLQLNKHCRDSFWLPIVRSKQNYTLWVNANNGSKTIEYLSWSFGQPNGYPTQNCVGALVLISPTFYKQFFVHMKVLCLAFLYLQLLLYRNFFCQKNIGAKAVNKNISESN